MMFATAWRTTTSTTMMTAQQATTSTMMAFFATGDNNDGKCVTTTTTTTTTMATGRQATKLTMMAMTQWAMKENKFMVRRNELLIPMLCVYKYFGAQEVAGKQPVFPATSRKVK